MIDLLFTPLQLARGPAMENRVALSPMTTDQAMPDGGITDDEVRWIRMRAEGGFGLVTTSAAYVQPSGKAGGGQTGIYSDAHIAGLTRLADEIKQRGRLAALQLHHAGGRAWKRTVKDIVAPSDDPETGARGLSTDEVKQLAQDFVAGAQRAERAGFDGVEIHGAHGYLLAQFLSPAYNRRTDQFGGSIENRSGVIFQIIQGIRRSCRPDFQLGLRLSPERWGLHLPEIRELAGVLMQSGDLDWLDLSLWDAEKKPEDAAFQHRALLNWFTDLPRGETRLGVTGKISTPARAETALEMGADFVFVGRTAIFHHDWPMRARNPSMSNVALPVSETYLAGEGCGPRFVRYLHSFQGLVEPTAVHT